MTIVSTLDLGQISAFRKSLSSAQQFHNGKLIDELSRSEAIDALRDALQLVSRYQERFGAL